MWALCKTSFTVVKMFQMKLWWNALKNSKFWILFQISHLLSRVEQSIMQQEAKLKIAYKESNQQLQVLDTK